MTIIRMNVDDLEEAFNLLTSHGFKAVDGSIQIRTDDFTIRILNRYRQTH